MMQIKDKGWSSAARLAGKVGYVIEVKNDRVLRQPMYVVQFGSEEYTFFRYELLELPEVKQDGGLVIKTQSETRSRKEMRTSEVQRDPQRGRSG